jgi:signal transduction histidine kinase
MIERLSERPSDDVVKDKLFHHLAVIEASVKTLSEAVTLGTTDIYHVKLERISSGQVLNHLVNRYRPSGLLSDKVSLVWLFPDQDIQFIGDGEKLKSMLHILIDNALKFTPRGTIHVQLSLSEDKILIQVADTGCGIPQHKLETIFEYGVSLSDEETPALQGSPPSSGRGLYYVKQFCEVLGGDVRVESTHGYRTMFTITLPRHSEADLPA